MKPLYLIAASTLALAAGACGSGPPKARAALDCPATQGDLTRTGVATDRKSCTYVTSDGAQVQLQLVAVNGGPDATLKTVETSLLAQLPSAAAPSPSPASAKPESTAAAITDKSATDAIREARQDTSGLDKDADPEAQRVEVGRGVVIVDEHDGKTQVNLPGIQIDADDSTDSARVRLGPIRIDANSDGMTFRSGPRNVRLRGEQLSREKRGIRATFIAERKGAADGSRFVAYEAGGPRIGPLTVATVKSSEEISDDDNIYRDVKKLVRHNGGV